MSRKITTRVGIAAGMTAMLATGNVLLAPGAMAQQYPPSTPSQQPTAPPGCRIAEARVLDATIIATGQARVQVVAAPNSTVDLFAYSRPSTTYRLVRTATTGSDGTVTFPALVPPTNTRIYAQQRGCAIGQSKVINVRTALSLFVERNGVRDYTFRGDSLPARPGGLIISLYRVTESGRQVLTDQTRANDRNGEWVMNRKFTGTGRFGFVVRTGQDLINAPGSSNVRSLLIF